MVLGFDGPIVPPSRRKRRVGVGTPSTAGFSRGKGGSAPATSNNFSGGTSDSLYSIKWKFVRDDDGEDVEDYSPAVSLQNTVRRMDISMPPGPHEDFPAPPKDLHGEEGGGSYGKKDKEDLSSLVQLLEELRGPGEQFFSGKDKDEADEITTEQVLQSIENEMPREPNAKSDRKEPLVPQPPAGSGRHGRGGQPPRSRGGSRQGTPSGSWGGSEAGSRSDRGERRYRPERGSRGGFSNASRSTATVQALMHGYVYPQERRRMLHTAAPRMTARAQFEWQSFQMQMEDERGSTGAGGEGSDEEGKDALLDDEERDAAEDAGSGAKDASRPGSPVILWRPSARVRLALDLPTELLQGDLLRDSDEEDSYEDYGGDGGSWDGSEGMMSGYTYDSDYYYFHKVWPAVDSSFGQYNEPHMKRRYGAWYIPPDLWGKELARREQRERGMAVTPEPMEAPDEGMDLRTLWQEKPLTEQQRQERAMAQQIQTVHSSKMYKAYIRDHHYRVPHYLQRVETPPKANPHKSRRGARGMAADDGDLFPPIYGGGSQEAMMGMDDGGGGGLRGASQRGRGNSFYRSGSVTAR